MASREYIESLPEPELTDIARIVLAKRYLIKDENGDPIEEPRDMFWRVAETIASANKEYGDTDEEVETLARDFYEMMAGGYWLPNSPTLMNAGRPLGQLSACFVLPVADTMANGEDGIYDTLKNMALIHQSGGGTGFSFSRLRPNGSMVKSTTGVASGPVSFMSLYDASTNVVKQGGTRRGANMGILRVDHPDIMEFINCKQDTSKIVNFNISVAITDVFMHALENDAEYNLVDPRTDEIVGSLRARDVWNQIAENAWHTGEPGLFFIDIANEENPVLHLGMYEATNPCGEQPLLPYDVCNLGSLNLGKFVAEPYQPIWDEGERDWKDRVDWIQMEAYIYLSMLFLDNVIDKNQFPLEKIADLSRRIRRVGNGVMGWADFLIKLGIPYNDDKALEVADFVAEFFVNRCREASEALAAERGVFPEWEGSVWGPETLDRPQRNCNVTTVAPTGTISMIAGCSSGIEPLYALEIERRQAGEVMYELNPLLAEYVEEYPNTDHRWLFVTSDKVSPTHHVKMQGTWQKYICSAISKTINMPEHATVSDVLDAYELAYRMRCKGITVYRDGSRPGQVLSAPKKEEEREEIPVIPEGAYERPETLNGRTHRIESPIGRMYVTVNRNEFDDPVEVFIAMGKAGGTATANAEAIGRLLSLALRHRIPLAETYRQLRGISSERAIGVGEAKVLSAPDAVAQVLEKYLNDRKLSYRKGEEYAICPDCASSLDFQEGCYVCHACGYSGCS